MFSALTVLAYTMLSGLSAVGESRQRTEATALANQALEQIRALPASQLYMSTSDLTGDPQLIACGTATCFNGRTVPTANFGASTISADPLSPHVTHVTGIPGNTVYTLKSYVTTDPADPTGDTLVATVMASWSSAEKGGVASSLQVESKVYNAQFNETAPNIHRFAASATGSPGQIKITGTVLGSSVVDVEFNMPSTSAGMNGTSLPNSTNVGASASPPTPSSVSSGIAQSGITGPLGLSLLKTPTATASVGSTAGSAPAGQTNTQTPTVAGSLPGAFGLVDTGALTGSASVGSTETASAEAASSATGGTITAGSPTPPTNGLGFGQATASQTGVVGANLSVLGLLGSNLLGIGLVSLTPTGNANPDYSTVAQNGAAGAPQLQTFNATANNGFTDLSILNLNGALGPLFPGPLLDLHGFQQTASACAKATAAPTCTATAQVDSGTISVLGGTPVSVTSLIQGLVPLSTLNMALTGINLSLIPALSTLGVTGTGITVGTDQSPGSVPSPLTINLMVNASLLGISLLNLTINITLGSASASASYS